MKLSTTTAATVIDALREAIAAAESEIAWTSDRDLLDSNERKVRGYRRALAVVEGRRRRTLDKETQ